MPSNIATDVRAALATALSGILLVSDITLSTYYTQTL